MQKLDRLRRANAVASEDYRLVQQPEAAPPAARETPPAEPVRGEPASSSLWPTYVRPPRSADAQRKLRPYSRPGWLYQATVS